MTRLSMLLIVVSLIAGMIGCDGGGADELIPDANLRAAIREAIDKPTGDIYPSDLAELKFLTAPSMDIFDLAGLEHCCFYLADLELQQIGPVREFMLAAEQICQLTPHLPHLLRHPCDLDSQRPKFRVTIQQIDVLAHPQQ